MHEMAEWSRDRVLRSVLVVEDDEVVARGWERALRSAGKDVRLASNRMSALAVRRSADVAIVDLHLENGESGLELLRELKFLDPTLHTVLISAGMSVRIAVEALRAGIDDCVVKPIVPRQLLRRLEDGDFRAEDELLSLEDVEWEHIANALRTHDGNISHAARALRMHRQSLQRKVRSRLARSIDDLG